MRDRSLLVFNCAEMIVPFCLQHDRDICYLEQVFLLFAAMGGNNAVRR